MTRAEAGWQSLVGCALWCWAVYLVYSVNRRLALAAFIGSIAFNLSEDVRHNRRRSP